MDEILNAFVVNEDKVLPGTFRFCGKEIKQNDDFSVEVPAHWLLR